MKLDPLLPPRRGEAPLPMEFPERFFVVAHDKDTEEYVIHTDEDNDYRMGSDPNVVRDALLRRGFPRRTADLVVDYAREFGAAQYVHNPPKYVDDRVIPLMKRDVEVKLEFKEPGEHRGLLHV